MKYRVSALALAAGLCLAGAVMAQSGQQSTQPQSPSSGERATTTPQPRTERAPADKAAAKIAKADSDFLKQAAQNGHAELEASKMAQSKATQSDVKAFAEKMVTEHTKTHQELATLAQSKGVALPDGPSLMQRAKLKMLAGAEGAKFDERYAESFGVKAHEDTIKLFRDGAAKAQDADVKSFAQKTLPALQEHLTLAKAAHATAAPTAAGKADRKTDAERGTSAGNRAGQGGTAGSTGERTGTQGEKKQ
jgi:putative membrane protein